MTRRLPHEAKSVNGADATEDENLAPDSKFLRRPFHDDQPLTARGEIS
jgi:hypothetical protein